jgi:two-component system, NarL family, sensor kinase
MKVNFGNRLITTFAIIILSVLILAFITHSTNQTYQNTFYWVKHTQQVLYLSEEVSSVIKDLESSTRGYVITGDRDFLEPFHKRRQTIITYLDSLKKLTADNPSQQRLINSLRYFTDEKLRFIESTVKARTTLGLEKAKELVQTRKGLNYMNSIEHLIEEIKGEENRLLKLREQANQKSTASFQFFFVIQTVALLLIIVAFAVMLFISLRARKRAKRQLSENNDLLQAIIDNTSSLIYLKDGDGRYTKVNRNFANHVELPTAQIIGKSDFDIFPQDVAISFQKTDERIQRQKQLIEFQEDVSYNGEMHHYYTIKFPISHANGEMYGICGISTNITGVILEQKLQRQREIAENTIEAQEKQRSEIAKELHDSVQQILAAANMMIDMALTASERRPMYLEKSKEFIQDAIREVRKLSHEMITPQFEEKPLTQALEEITDNINLTGSLYAVVSVENEEEINALREKIKLALYRIVQEQVSNVLKYSKAREMTIELKVAAKTVYLTVSDNGQGFDTQSKPKGIGLKNIASRAELLSGKTDILSAPGEGCTLHVEIPV